MPESDISQIRSHAGHVAGFLKSLANENRLLILCSLLDGEKCVGDINADVDISSSALSQHLAWLREAGMVNSRRQSQTIFYSLADDRVEKTLGLLKEMFCA